ncbi:unnamed protein product [Acanthoscelides obtectus]|uniref:RRM domain-containing protein n=1 Tax=Acanthoscelides obtectus TaxID=200917 RepID=A0A9P0K1F6_ACAOB|nr:unnamed protein product [Acanthoscelides obtectus]CAK1639495.1 Apoptotic chromatin condensation inducer in the nucleus [Acanthoscelides obtectus]
MNSSMMMRETSKKIMYRVIHTTSMEIYRKYINKMLRKQRMKGTTESPPKGTNPDEHNVENCIEDDMTNEDNEASAIRKPEDHQNMTMESSKEREPNELEHHLQDMNKESEATESENDERTKGSLRESEASIAYEPEQDNFQSEYSTEKSDKVKDLKHEQFETSKKTKLQLPNEEDKSIKLPPKKITLKRLQSKVTLQNNKPEDKEKSTSENDSSVTPSSSTEVSTGKEELASSETDKMLKRRHSDAVAENKEEKKRRSSVTSCENKTELEAKVRKHQPKIHLIRQRSFVENTTDDAIVPKPKRPALWGCSSGWFSNINASLYKIDVDAVKIVCPTIEFLKEDDVKLDPVPKEKEKKEVEKMIESWSVRDDAEMSENREEMEATSANPFTHNRKVSIIEDSFRNGEQPMPNSEPTMSILAPPRAPSPAKNPVSPVLLITNLVRPFTIKQLKELLQRTGKIVEDGFWTDRIKSKCYVQYETEEGAVATRNALHGINWPISNGKKLKIDFATVEDLEKAKNPVTVATLVIDPVNEKENKHSLGDRKEKPEDVKPRDLVKDWELKKVDPRKRSRSRSRERVRKHSRRSYTPEGLPKKHKKHDDDVPQKLMDDLFLKTKTTPSIYWQPLSPEEIAKKQHQRLVCMEEYKRRIEEKRERIRESRHGAYRRR